MIASSCTGRMDPTIWNRDRGKAKNWSIAKRPSPRHLRKVSTAIRQPFRTSPQSATPYPTGPGERSFREAAEMGRQGLWQMQRRRFERHDRRSSFRESCWLGRQDSNLRMAAPKAAALPLGDAPTSFPGASCGTGAVIDRARAYSGAGRCATSVTAVRASHGGRARARSGSRPATRATPGSSVPTRPSRS